MLLQVTVYCFMKSEVSEFSLASNIFNYAKLGPWNAKMKLRQYVFFLSQAAVGKLLLSATLPCKPINVPEEFISPGNTALACLRPQIALLTSSREFE